jgi:hypothetical protein
MEKTKKRRMERRMLRRLRKKKVSIQRGSIGVEAIKKKERKKEEEERKEKLD